MMAKHTKHKLNFLLRVCLLLTVSLTASTAWANTLKDVSFTSLPGDRVEIRLMMADSASLPTTFTIDNPARIAMDFSDTKLAWDQKSKNISVGIARSISAVQAGGRTRVVINLARMVEYDTVVEGNDIFITLGKKSVQNISEKQGNFSEKQDITANVQSVDFRRGEKGEGRILLTLSDPNTAVDLQQRGDKVLVTLKNSRLPEEFERRLDVLDFATPVKTVDSFNQGSDVRIIISAIGKYEHLGYQTDNIFSIDVKPEVKVKDENVRNKKKVYSGERLSLNFQNIEVRAVLQLIADFTGINMVTSDTVSGDITLRLKNVPWDQALDIILKTKGLDKRVNGNVMLVAPTEEIAQREKLEIESRKQVEELAPLITESIQVNYAKAASFVTLFSGTAGGGAAPGGGSAGAGNTSRWLSSRGVVTLDQRTNKILVVDVQEKVDAIVAMVKELDIPVRQVLIESRIVIANTEFSKELGVRFGVSKRTSGNTGTPSEVGIGVSNTGVNADIARGGTIPTRGTRYNVDLPASNLGSAASIGLALARLPFGTLLDLELSAAQAEGRSETISSPRVITANQRKAHIKQGIELPYLEATSSGASSTAFKEALLALEVTPQITPDETIIMDLLVKKDRPVQFGDFRIPSIDKREIVTQVRVSNGETIVLGGVYEQDTSNRVSKVPFFGDLPLIGALFRTKFEENNKNELLIFITPKIVSDDLKI